MQKPTRKRFNDLEGKEFGRWTILDYVGMDKRKVAQWLCICSCCATRVVSADSLLKGRSLSCGCSRLEFLLTGIRRTHGRTRTVEYKAWCGMIRRCTNPKNIGCENYLERGITVCERWKYSFENFFEDMGEKPSPMYSLDRKDNTGNYEPDNCRWATPKEQARNTSRNSVFTVDGEDMTLAEISEKYGLNYSALQRRMNNYGWSIERAISTPIRSCVRRSSLIFVKVL